MKRKSNFPRKEPRVAPWLFSHSWEHRKLGEIAVFNPKDDLPCEFEYVDLESVVGTEMLSHRRELKQTAPSRAQRLARTGDLFYQTVRPYQKNNYLFELTDNDYVFSTGYAQLRPEVDGYFLLSLVQQERFVKVVLDNCTGTSYPAINSNDLADIIVSSPLFAKESQKLGQFFRYLDRLITLHQRVQCVTSLLISCEFDRFTIFWEQRKLGELCQKTTGGGTPSTGVAEYWNGEIPWFQSSDFKEGIVSISSSNKHVSQAGLQKSAAQLIPEQSIAIVARVGFGKLSLIPFQYTTSQDILSLSNLTIDPLYGVYTIYKKLQSELMSVQGTSIKGVTKDDLLAKDISVSPNDTEQQKIGLFFHNLDDLITLHQRELKPVKNRVKMAFLITALNNYDSCPLRFTFAWEQRKVSEIGTFSKGTGYSKSDIRDKGTPLILYGRLYTKYETVIREVDTFTTPKDGSVYSRGGEVIVPASGETAEDISIASVVEKAGVILGGDLNIITPQSGIDSAFLALSISHGEAHRSLSKLAQGKSVVHIHNSDIQTVEVGIPVQAEQESISQFFEKVDRLITLHQREFTHKKTNTNYVKYYQRNRPLLCVLRSMDKSV